MSSNDPPHRTVRTPYRVLQRKREAARSANDRLQRAIARSSSALFAVVLLGPLPGLAFQFGVAPNPVLVLDSQEAGARPAHRLSFDVQSGELEVYRAVITYPDEGHQAVFIVRLARDPTGKVTGVVERVRTGEKERVAAVEEIGQVLVAMLGRGDPAPSA